MKKKPVTFRKADKSMDEMLYGGMQRNVAKKLGMTLMVANVERPKMGWDFNDIQDPDAPFWCGVVVGHWLMGPLANDPEKKNRPSHVCVSKCGVAEYYEPWEIASGRLPATCYGCRPGNHRAPPHRVLPEEMVKAMSAFWEDGTMAVAFEERSNARGKEANDAWYSLGRPLMARVVDGTGYGQHFGWKLYVRTCDSKSYKLDMKKDSIRLRAIHKSEKRIEIVLQPAGSHYEFTLDLATGRTDYDFMEVAERVKGVIESICPKEEKKVETKPEPKALAAAATPQPSENGHSKVVNVEALKSIAGNLDRLIRVAGDMNEVAGLKHVAQEKYRQASEKARESYIRLVGAQEERDKAQAMAKAHWERVADLENKLRIEMQLRDAAHEVAASKASAAQAAESEYAPLVEAAEKAKTEIADLERMEAENLKSVGDSKNLEVLLAALSKMG